MLTSVLAFFHISLANMTQPQTMVLPTPPLCAAALLARSLSLTIMQAGLAALSSSWPTVHPVTGYIP